MRVCCVHPFVGDGAASIAQMKGAQIAAVRCKQPLTSSWGKNGKVAKLIISPISTPTHDPLGKTCFASIVVGDALNEIRTLCVLK
jgi:hypothetical protein